MTPALNENISVRDRALAEARNSGVDSLILFHIDDTVETAIVLENKIYGGSDGTAGNFAHTVLNFGGYECSCGRRGCLSAYVSTAGMRRQARDCGVEDADTLTLPALFSRTDAAATLAKNRYVENLASAVTSAINLFQTREFVITGAPARVGDALYLPMMEIVLREQYSRNMPNKCNVRFAK